MPLFAMVTAYHLINSQAQHFDRRKLLPILYRRVLAGTIRRRSLQTPSTSIFNKVYHSTQLEALIQLCGFHKTAFDQLLSIFKPYYNAYTPHSKTHIRRLKRSSGRRRLLDAKACLGLVLAWLRTRGAYRILCFTFGIIPSSCSIWLRFGKRCLIMALKTDPAASPSMPSDDDVRRYETMIQVKYPSLIHCWGAMDGLKLEIESSGDPTKQNMFYNGWKCDTFISNLFLFSPDGRICACYFNAPGSVHDSSMASISKIYNRIQEVYNQTGSRVVVDSAFSLDGCEECMIKSHQNNLDKSGNPRQNINLHRDATSVRQLSEWGMRGLQGSFPRLRDRIPYEERGERKLLIQLVVYLYNYRSEHVGLNQIRTTYATPLAHSANSLRL